MNVPCSPTFGLVARAEPAPHPLTHEKQFPRRITNRLVVVEEHYPTTAHFHPLVVGKWRVERPIVNLLAVDALWRHRGHEVHVDARMSTCKKGKVFYQPQETGEVLFLLKRGKMQLYRIASDGWKIITGTIDPGTFFGEMSLIGQHMYGSFAEATEDCLLCVMSRTDLERVRLEAQPKSPF